MEYKVRVYDNFHYMDESEAYDLTDFATIDEAEDKARQIIIDFMEQNYKSGMKSDELYKKYLMFGEEPFIQASKEETDFSAREFAQVVAKDVCRN